MALSLLRGNRATPPSLADDPVVAELKSSLDQPA